MSKLCDDKLRTRCVSRVVCDVDDVEEEGGGRSRRAGEGGSAEPKTRTPHKDVGKKYDAHNYCSTVGQFKTRILWFSFT